MIVLYLSEDIEEEGLHVVVERLVVQEQLDEQAEVLTVDLVRVPVHLEHGQPLFPTRIKTQSRLLTCGIV